MSKKYMRSGGPDDIKEKNDDNGSPGANDIQIEKGQQIQNVKLEKYIFII